MKIHTWPWKLECEKIIVTPGSIDLMFSLHNNPTAKPDEDFEKHGGNYQNQTGNWILKSQIINF